MPPPPPKSFALGKAPGQQQIKMGPICQAPISHRSIFVADGTAGDGCIWSPHTPCHHRTRTPNQPPLPCSTGSSLAYPPHSAGKEVVGVGNGEGSVSNWFEGYLGIKCHTYGFNFQFWLKIFPCLVFLKKTLCCLQPVFTSLSLGKSLLENGFKGKC